MEKQNDDQYFLLNILGGALPHGFRSAELASIASSHTMSWKIRANQILLLVYDAFEKNLCNGVFQTKGQIDAWFRNRCNSYDELNGYTVTQAGITYFPFPTRVSLPSDEDCEKDKELLEDDVNQSSCVVCLDRLPMCVVMPCMHKCICCTCARALPKHDCPVCRKPFIQIARVYE